jgi:uroporphyrinogen decarboxylase
MMGLENLSYALYEDKKLVVDIMDHMLYWNMEIMKKIFAAGIKLDFCYLWEDIAYKSGPLFSPKIMRELMIPRWKVFTELLRENGVTVILVDCDGNVDELVPLVLEGGCNAMLPFEVAADNDVLAVRKKYGKNLTIIGGIDKRALAKGKTAIDAEIERVRPLLAQGGYFPTLDHYAPPDIPFMNYMYYRIKLKSMRTAD